MFYHQQGTFSLGGPVRPERNRKNKLALVKQGRSHGIIVYSNKMPVGWCQYGIREELPRIETIRAYKRRRPYKGKR